MTKVTTGNFTNDVAISHVKNYSERTEYCNLSLQGVKQWREKNQLRAK